MGMFLLASQCPSQERMHPDRQAEQMASSITSVTHHALRYRHWISIALSAHLATHQVGSATECVVLHCSKLKGVGVK